MSSEQIAQGSSGHMGGGGAPQPLPDYLAGRLREMIMQGALVPGRKIPEQEISAALGASRTPLREALRRLAGEGLVELVPNRGAIVAVLTAQEVRELFPILGALEALAGEMVCARASDAEIAGLRALHRELAAHHQAGREAEYRAANWAFHARLIELAGNRPLLETWEQLLRRSHAARFTQSKSSEDWNRAMADHEAIIAALEARDPVGLGGILRRHLSQTAVASVLNTLEAGRTLPIDGAD